MYSKDFKFYPCDKKGTYLIQWDEKDKVKVEISSSEVKDFVLSKSPHKEACNFDPLEINIIITDEDRCRFSIVTNRSDEEVKIYLFQRRRIVDISKEK